MLEPLGDDPEGERLHARDRFGTASGVALDARQVSYFRQPTAVVFALRFSSPRGFSVDEGFEPDDYIGLQIVDVSSRQQEGIGVEVSCFENTPGLRFFARAVEAL